MPGRTIARIALILALVLSAQAGAQAKGPVAWWGFDDASALDKAGDIKDEITGFHKFMPGGVQGRCLRFDGFTTLVRREAKKAPALSGEVTFSAWVAIGAYSWNWTPILCQHENQKRGFYFGMNHKRQFGLRVAVDGKWVECIAEPILEMRRWYLVTAVYEPKSGITLYLDGRAVGHHKVTGDITFAPDIDLHIGRNHEKMLPVDRVRKWAQFPSWWSHDGMFDEIRIYNRTLTAKEIMAQYEAEKPSAPPDISPRQFPDVKGIERFGAYPANLKYYEQWDALWQMAGKQDVVVRFDDSPVSMVFWRGTHYSPCWVSENGKWMADQSLETGVWPDKFDDEDYQGAVGCSEHMSDTECRFAHVKIIENTPARVVVHWRYAMTDCNLKFARYDEVAGRGQWGDEFYYIYPDVVATRHVVGWWPNRYEDAHQETIFLSEPGTRPEDNCHLDAITLVGWKGESKTYSWAKGFPRLKTPRPVIQMVNLKSDYKPYMILGLDSKLHVFGGEVRKGYSKFPWWNHWPVARTHSDGRYAEAPDRAAHSSLTQTTSSNKTYLYGMANKLAKEMLPLARSWISPPGIKIASKGFENKGYDVHQRSYRIESIEPGKPLEIALNGSTESPVFNPAFVIKNWGAARPVVKVNGKTIPWGKDARFGHRYDLKSTDLVIWIREYSNGPVSVALAPEK